MLSLELDRSLYGAEPAGYLLTNVALHVASALLLFHVVWRMTGAVLASGFVAAVFALHPLHVESVAWASERKDTLSALFFMLTWLAYLRYVEQPRRLRYALLMACLALGLLSKPMLVTLPFVLLLLDYWPLRRLDFAAVREKLPLLALAAADSLATFVVQGARGAMSYGLGVPLYLRVANAIDSTFVYLWQTLWPSGLAVFYAHPAASLDAPRVALAAGVLLLLSAAAFALRRAQPWWIVGWLWYLGMLVPVIGLVQVRMQGRADRYTYLPMIGLSLGVAFGARHLARTRAQQRALAVVATASLATCAWLASIQVATWRNSFTLYERVIAVAPDSSYPHQRLGMVHAMQSDFGRARQHFQRAIELEPQEAKEIVHQLGSMAKAHARESRFEAAVSTAAFAIALAEETGQPEAAASLRAHLPELRSPFR
jgi:tetratricopeptide (TPR) repeat protein